MDSIVTSVASGLLFVHMRRSSVEVVDQVHANSQADRSYLSHLKGTFTRQHEVSRSTRSGSHIASGSKWWVRYSAISITWVVDYIACVDALLEQETQLSGCSFSAYALRPGYVVPRHHGGPRCHQCLAPTTSVVHRNSSTLSYYESVYKRASQQHCHRPRFKVLT